MRIVPVLTVFMIVLFMGCAQSPKVWVDSPDTKSHVTGSWEGTWWKADDQRAALPLSCVCLQTGDDEWTATFDAECGRPASFTFDISGKRAGDKVVFGGTVDLGAENGGVYQWKGEVIGNTFVGEYTNPYYNGAFKMEKL